MRQLGGKALKWQSMNNRGVTDRVCIMPPTEVHKEGRIALVELKRNTKARLSPTQVKFHDELTRLRVPNVVVLHGKEEVEGGSAKIFYAVQLRFIRRALPLHRGC